MTQFLEKFNFDKVYTNSNYDETSGETYESTADDLEWFMNEKYETIQEWVEKGKYVQVVIYFSGFCIKSRNTKELCGLDPKGDTINFEAFAKRLSLLPNVHAFTFLQSPEHFSRIRFQIDVWDYFEDSTELEP